MTNWFVLRLETIPWPPYHIAEMEDQQVHVVDLMDIPNVIDATPDVPPRVVETIVSSGVVVEVPSDQGQVVESAQPAPVILALTRDGWVPIDEVDAL